VLRATVVEKMLFERSLNPGQKSLTGNTFAAVIRCTADLAKADKRTKIKESR
jgi:hypothetical protein